MEQIKCPSCGASLTGKVNFCEYCGASFYKKETQENTSSIENDGIDSIEDYKAAMKEAAQNFPQMHEAMGEFQKAAFKNTFKGPMRIIPIIFSIIFFATFVFILITVISSFINF